MRQIIWRQVRGGYPGQAMYLAPGRAIDFSYPAPGYDPAPGAAGAAALRWAASALNRLSLQLRIENELNDRLQRDAQVQMRGHGSGGVLAIVFFNAAQTEAGVVLDYVASFVDSGVYAQPDHAISVYRAKAVIEPRHNGTLFFWGVWG